MHHRQFFKNSRWAVGFSLAKVLCVCLSLHLLSAAWNTFSASFCRVHISTGLGLMRGLCVTPAAQVTNSGRGRYTDTQYRTSKGKWWPSDFAAEGTWIRGPWEPFNCFYLAWELICSNSETRVEPSLHRDYSLHITETQGFSCHSYQEESSWACVLAEERTPQYNQVSMFSALLGNVLTVLASLPSFTDIVARMG